jgi:hypothetical protein
VFYIWEGKHGISLQGTQAMSACPSDRTETKFATVLYRNIVISMKWLVLCDEKHE